MMKITRRAFLGSALATGVSGLSSCANEGYKEIKKEYEILDIALPLIVSSVNGAPADAKSKEIKISDDVALYAVLWTRDFVDHDLFFSELDEKQISGKRLGLPKSMRGEDFFLWRWNESRYGPIEIKWYQIKPERRIYTNTPHRAKIEFDAEEIGSGWSIKPAGLGTHRYVIAAKYFDGFVPSLRGEISEENITNMHRISIRESDDFVGWMTDQGNNAYVYGSYPDQVENRLGTDCADLITWALRQTGRKDFQYTWSQGFRTYGDVIFRGYLSMNGEFVDSEKRKTDLGLRRGDLLVYKSPYRHVAVIHEDSGPERNGIEVVHAYDEKGPIVEKLYQKSYPHISFREKLYNLRPQLENPQIKNPAEEKLDNIEIIRLK